MKEFDSDKDYYDILGVEENATPEEIEKMFRQQARKHHPDSGGTEEAMKALNEAHTILKDDAIRRDYDQFRSEQRGYPRSGTDTTRPLSHDENERTHTPAGYSSGDFLGRLISALTFLGAGLIFFFVVEINWVFFLWPLRLLALCILAISVYLTYAAFKVKQQQLKSSANRKLAEVGFWLLVCCGACLIVLSLIFLH
ncbi:MAG TPA: DnaJ domain-containing protein [Blastocatellia bacterium]|nr:DnaJ domain-containing protein [Blastocatellia bacterium]